MAGRVRRQGGRVEPTVGPRPPVAGGQRLPLWRCRRGDASRNDLGVHTIEEPGRRTRVDGDSRRGEAKVRLAAQAGDDDRQGGVRTHPDRLVAVHDSRLEPGGRKEIRARSSVARRRHSADVGGSGRRQQGGDGERRRKREQRALRTRRASEANALRPAPGTGRGRAPADSPWGSTRYAASVWVIRRTLMPAIVFVADGDADRIGLPHRASAAGAPTAQCQSFGRSRLRPVEQQVLAGVGPLIGADRDDRGTLRGRHPAPSRGREPSPRADRNCDRAGR